jgi:hypothetical protein
MKFQHNLLQATNLAPGDSGQFNDSFAESARVGGTEHKAEVLHCNAEGVEHLYVDRVPVEVNEVHLLMVLFHGGKSYIRANCACRQ